MGCMESSRRVKQIRVVQADEDDVRRGSKVSVGTLKPPRTPLPNQIDPDEDLELHRLPTGELGDSTEWRRGAEGTERKSGSSPDSGVFELLGMEYAAVVTEKSAPELVQQVEDDFRSPESGTDLIVTGRACPRRISTIRTEEAAILHLLQQEGLLTKEKAATTGGLSYELVSEDAVRGEGACLMGPGARLPPLKLEKLEKRRSRHRKNTELSEQQISEKLERAEERRRDAEQEKMKRLAERASSARPEVRQLEHLARVQRSMEKFESTIENREQHLQNLREKLRQRHERAAVIRLKKSMASRDDLSRLSTPDQNETLP